MFETLKHEIRLRLLQAKKRLLIARYDGMIDKTAKESEAWPGLVRRRIDEPAEIDARIAHLHSFHLIDRAQRYMLAYPEFSFDSVHWVLSPSVRLRPEAMEELRAKIRKEERERWEAWTRWIPFLTGMTTAITGLVGALIGLAAVLFS